jgi:hypothetical protein
MRWVQEEVADDGGVDSLETGNVSNPCSPINFLILLTTSRLPPKKSKISVKEKEIEETTTTKERTSFRKSPIFDPPQ